MPSQLFTDFNPFFHETIHELDQKKLEHVLLKIDFEKATAYVKLNSSFLQQALPTYI
jgi:hypothetical protein